MVLDTDSIFHGVDRVSDVPADAVPRLRPGMTLDSTAARTWAVHDRQGDEVSRYAWDELRFSVSWKAYCFQDARERDTWREHRDDLTIDVILDRLVDDLARRGVVDRDVARNSTLGRTLISEYIRFPVSTAPSTG
jgi:hypothetical protein